MNIRATIHICVEHVVIHGEREELKLAADNTKTNGGRTEDENGLRIEKIKNEDKDDTIDFNVFPIKTLTGREGCVGAR